MLLVFFVTINASPFLSSFQYKTASTRKLRRRGADPTPTVEKRRKTVQNIINYVLPESEIEDDLRIINNKTFAKGTPKPKGNC